MDWVHIVQVFYCYSPDFKVAICFKLDYDVLRAAFDERVEEVFRLHLQAIMFMTL